MARRSGNDGHTVATNAAVDLSAAKNKGFFSKFRRGKEDESAMSGRVGGDSVGADEVRPTIEIKVPAHRMAGDDPSNASKSASRALLNLTLSEPPSDNPRIRRSTSGGHRTQRNRSSSPSSRRRRGGDEGSVVSVGSAPISGRKGKGSRRRPGDDEGSAVSAASAHSAPMSVGRNSNRKRITLERLKQSSEQINKSYRERKQRQTSARDLRHPQSQHHQQQQQQLHRQPSGDNNGNGAHRQYNRIGGGSTPCVSKGPIHIDNIAAFEQEERRKPRQTGSGRRFEGSVYTAPTILNLPSGGSSVRSAPTIVQKPTENDVNSRCHLSVVDKPRPRNRAPSNATTATPNSGVRLPSVPESSQQQMRGHVDLDPRRTSIGTMNLSASNIFSDSSSRRSSTGSGGSSDMYFNSSGMLDPESLRRHMARGMQAPEGDVTIIFTDLQGSTTLWETHPPAMKAAVDLHDKIVRRCYTEHSGYEITTEGDAFQLAFQHPIDALAFALKTQIELHNADWSKEITSLEDASEKGGFRGFRVRMGLHHGPTKSRVHDVTGRTFYEGEAVEIAKAMEGMCHGGQILTTVETWRAVSGISEQVLGSPQVMDCGEHQLDIKDPKGKGLMSKRVVQLVPKELSFDYFAARGREENPSTGHVRYKKETDVVGRKFAPLKTKKQLSTSFVDAPYANGKVTIVFVYTKGINDQPAELKTKNLRILAKGVRSLLMQSNPPGYECQEENGSWMIAFGRIANAVSFGLRLVEAIDKAPLKGDVDRSKMFRIGIHTGPFTSMGPHTVTGRADYFGPVVNRAARVASQCELGQVLIGIPLANGEEAIAPDFGNKIVTSMVGIRKLKGLTVDMALFSCARAPR